MLICPGRCLRIQYILLKIYVGDVMRLVQMYIIVVVFVVVMALQPFARPSPLFQFLDPIHSW
jgi:hypothetical protein